MPRAYAVGVVAVCVGVVFGPLLLGATFPWSRLGLEAIMTIAILCWMSTRPGAVCGLALAGVVAALGGLQMVPMPDAVLLRIAPVSAGAWKVANPDAWGTIAVDPGATAAGLRRLLLGLGTIGAVAAFGRYLKARTAIMSVMAIACVLTLALAFAFHPRNDDRMMLGFIDLSGPIDFWKSPVHAAMQTAGFSESDVVQVAGFSYLVASWVAGDRIGPYIVSNHFAGGMCLMLPVSIALWLWWSRGRLSVPARIGGGVAMAAVALFAVAVIAKSRAGTASLVLALSWLSCLVVSGSALRKVTALVAGAGIAAWLMVVGAMYGPLRGLERLLPANAQSSAATFLADGRVLASQLAQRMLHASPWLGTGFGSYYGLSGHLDQRNPPWYYAHNDYVQFLAETGFVGGMIAVACGVWLAATAWRFYRNIEPPGRIQAAGCWAALIGIGAHSAFDWNLHVPANAFLACVVTGLAVSSVPRVATAPPPGMPDRRLTARLLVTTGTVVYVVCFLTLVRDAWSDGRQRSLRGTLATARATALPVDHPLRIIALDDAIQLGERTRGWDPANAQLAVLTGLLQLHAAALCDSSQRELLIGDAETCFREAARLDAALRGIPVRHVRTGM